MKKVHKNWDYWWNHYLQFGNHQMSRILEHTKKLTPIESITFLTLLDLTNQFGINNFWFMPQQSIGKYRVDFLVTYEPIDNGKVSKKIVIECDGHEWHERTKEQAAHDKERDRFFIKEGYIVLRYSGSEIVNDRFKIYHDIEELLIPEKLKESFGYFKEKRK